ncbi:hypothetical protein [Cryobacterium sp. BB307]|uniref:hypothetical protein n=1 Tax=Cryobacterium sp. BB307 TaxID=2716317 RepID=UPI001446138C|nr:hypothetical protein [Cryobacterium sp. BB307]
MSRPFSRGGRNRASLITGWRWYVWGGAAWIGQALLFGSRWLVLYAGIALGTGVTVVDAEVGRRAGPLPV